jgi:hypothetical protein
VVDGSIIINYLVSDWMVKAGFIWGEIQEVADCCESGYELGLHKMRGLLDWLRRSPMYTLLHAVTEIRLTR